MEASPSPLSSRAKPRDLQFSGPFLGMFSTVAWRENLRFSLSFSVLCKDNKGNKQ